jgi:hypothetical protein
MISDELKAIFDADEDGILDTPEKPAKLTATDRLERSFIEIIEFVKKHDREPRSDTREIAERKLGARLDGIRLNDEKIQALKHLDEFDLLVEPDPPASLDELLEGDDLDLLGDDIGLFDTSMLPARKSPIDPDFVAKREKAKNFDQFEPLFRRKHEELAEGAVKLIPFPGRHLIQEGAFFVLNGVMLFVAEVGKAHYKEVGGKPERKERLRCIFENGTESSMYRSSLSIRLHEDEGQAVVLSTYESILSEDQPSGYIYVLRSLSDDPQISSIPNLHKIGFTRGKVEDRIVNAEQTSTYLMAPVEIAASYRAYNLKASALEHLLHRLFTDARLTLDQVGKDGRIYEPSEWFAVPLSVINKAVELIVSGDIVDYEYDAVSRELKIRQG